MNYQEFVDHVTPIACVISAQFDADGSHSDFCIEAANAAYLESVHVDPADFVPGRPYYEYIGREYNFEAMSLKCMQDDHLVHSYVDADLYNAWMDIYMMPLASDTEGTKYSLFSYEMHQSVNVEKLSDVTAQTALQVLRTTLKLRETDDFQAAMNSIIEDIREHCKAASCRILLTDFVNRKCTPLCESVIDKEKFPPMTYYLDDSFFDVVDTWEDMLAGSNCVIIQNPNDMAMLKEVCPVWYHSLRGAGVEAIVFFPIRQNNETLGYIWAINFDVDRTQTIKSTLEITTFILASEIANWQLFNQMKTLSVTDLLTGVYNRNAMNNRISNIVDGTEELKMPYGVVFIDLNGLKLVNDTDGHRAGDHLLKDAAALIGEVFTGYEIFRIGGDEFLVIATDISEEDFNALVESLRKKTKESEKLKLAIGSCYAGNDPNIRQAMKRADKEMYKDKEAYYSSI